MIIAALLTIASKWRQARGMDNWESVFFRDTGSQRLQCSRRWPHMHALNDLSGFLFLSKRAHEVGRRNGEASKGLKYIICMYELFFLN